MSLLDIAKKIGSGHPITKPLSYYENYDEIIKNNGITPKYILEIGVFQGESTKIFSTRYPESKIVALDLNMQDIDFSEYPNITYAQCDQTDRKNLSDIIKFHFPDGIDLIIEDASHIGALSAITFEICFPSLKSGGLYIVEDWGTGYWDTWVDGGRYQHYPLNFYESTIPKRLPSHDFGMVGFVKSLVDYTHESAVKPRQQDECNKTSRIKSLHFTEGLCMAIKA